MALAIADIDPLPSAAGPAFTHFTQREIMQNYTYGIRYKGGKVDFLKIRAANANSAYARAVKIAVDYAAVKKLTIIGISGEGKK